MERELRMNCHLITFFQNVSYKRLTEIPLGGNAVLALLITQYRLVRNFFDDFSCLTNFFHDSHHSYAIAH